MILELKPIPKEAIKELLKKAVYDTDRGMGTYNGTIDEDALDFLADISGGDARHALNAIELGIMTTEPSADGKIHITLDVHNSVFRREQHGMIKMVTIITIPFPHLSKVCGGLIRTRRYITWREC